MLLSIGNKGAHTMSGIHAFLSYRKLWDSMGKEVLSGQTVTEGVINIARTQHLQIYHREAQIYR